ncbi:PspC domain-containing protein [Flavobacterium luteum]|uniref:PspC domain-containing protein n=1 Tax=Flavobacterium luteum TaxID=2026654 RepID=A0A7J5ABY0_9FLAO|nr:PspC domain-containing protein [Flavobacterium luteum]KAB1155040.1 PspC domain-containing protein [Flavobacterium luteum]
MNKTVNINLGGMFFHIDEDAYQKLTRYFEAIKRSLSNANGEDEIIKDIELRIAELITEKNSNDKHVINLKVLDEIIAVMGQPEDYRIDSDGEEQQKNDYTGTNRVTKKLYRDKDKGSIAGVCTGLGHYFGIEAVWIKILFLILATTSFGIIAYIILWIVMPVAITTSEKLEMTGEPITISNIEKKVREEYDTVSDKLKNADYNKMGNQVKTGFGKFISEIGDVFLSIFKIFAKILGVIIIMSSLAILVILFIGVFTIGSTAFIEFPWQDFVNAGNFSDYPIWSFGLLMFLAVGIPFFFLLLLGFKLLSPSVKSIGNIAKYTLIALWSIAIGLLISLGIKQASEFAEEGRIVQKQSITIKPADTLLIKFKHNNYFAKDVFEYNNFMITEDSTDNKVIYSNQVRLKILKTDEKVPYLQIEKQARGKSLSEARKTADKIKYGFKIIGNQLILDNYLITDFKSKYRDQEVQILLYLPEGTFFKPDNSVKEYDDSDDSFFNLHFSSDEFIYKMGSSQVKCLNCPKEENEWNDVENSENTISKKDSITTTTVNVNGEKVIIKQIIGKEGLTTDVNGVIIKKQ